MKIAIVCITLFLTVVVGLLATGGQRTVLLAEPRTGSEEGPEYTVREFRKLIENEQSEVELSKITSPVPRSYFEAKEREVAIYSELSNKAVVAHDKQNSEEMDSIESGAPEASIPSREVSLIEYDIKQLAADSAFLGQVRRVSATGDEARVRVVLFSKPNPRYRAVRDVLLFKFAGAWKVFMVAGVGLVNVYGLERPEIRSDQEALTEGTQ